MELILNNPFRTIGLLVGANAREQERQVKRLMKFIDANKEPEDDFSFSSLGKMHRAIENVNKAVANLNLDSDKMNAALFWFYKGNPITDEPAFEAIKEGDIGLVFSIWTKLTSNEEVSQRNASAYSNLGTLYLSGILEGKNTNEVLLEQGISLKLKFLESDFINDFIALVTDKTFKTTNKELQLLFLNQVLSEIESNSSISSNKFLDIINNQEFTAKDHFLKGFVQKPIEQIEKEIEEAKTKRKENNANAVNIGNSLYIKTEEQLKQIKSILGTSNLKFSSLSDKVSDEILQCGIDYFLHYKDSSTDPGIDSMDLFRKAKTLAIGDIIIQRCQENIENFKGWIDDKPERDKKRLIGDDLQFITSKLEQFQNLPDEISNANGLIKSCRPKLNNIKKVLGVSDDFYLKISTLVASSAQVMITSTVNIAMEKRNSFVSYQNYLINSKERKFTNNNFNFLKNYVTEVPYAEEYSISDLKDIIYFAWKVTKKIGLLNMSNEQRNYYINNKESLKKIYQQINLNVFFYKDNLINKWLLGMLSFFLLLVLISLIWSLEEAGVVFMVVTVIAISGFIQNAFKLQ